MEKPMKQRLFWGLVALTVVVYALMLAWSLPIIAAAAGGLSPFDVRPGGYTFTDATAFLAALTPDGARFYAEIQQRLDIVYPALISATLFFAIAFLTPLRGGWQWAPALLALPVAMFDYFENHAVAMMLEAGMTGLTAAMVESASQWTVLKSIATTVAMLMLAALLCLKAGKAAWRRFWRPVRLR
jgi:hypothetical protein